MPDDARGVHPDVEVTVRRVDVAPTPRRGRRREREGARISRPDAVVLLAAAAVVIALLYAAAQAREA